MNVDSPTTPQAIVTGNDPEKTNELLQELGIALYIHRNKNGLASDGKSKTNLSSYKSSEKLSKLGDNRGSRSSKAEPKEIVEVIETWPLEVSVAFSIDNKNWESATNHTTQLSDAAGQFIIPLKGEDKITSKFMKIIVMKCSAKVADVAGMCAIRLQLKETIEVNSDSDDQNSPS